MDEVIFDLLRAHADRVYSGPGAHAERVAVHSTDLPYGTHDKAWDFTEQNGGIVLPVRPAQEIGPVADIVIVREDDAPRFTYLIPRVVLAL